MWPLDASHIADWLERYHRARKSYVRGFISRNEAKDALVDLRYRDDALRIEMLEWERAKIGRKSRVTMRAWGLLKDYIDDGQIQKRINQTKEPPPS